MPVKISAKGGNKNIPSKKSKLLHPKGKEQKNILKKSYIFSTDAISIYSNPPNSEIDEIVCQGIDEIGNDVYFIKLKNQSYKNRKCIKRKEFKNYFNGEQVFNYFSKLTFRKTVNQLFLLEEKILHCIVSNKKTAYLIKWALLPISYSTWENGATTRAINNYNNRHKISLPNKIDINTDLIQIPNKYGLNPVQIDTVKNIIRKFSKSDTENSSHFALLGGVGSIMRKEIYASFNCIQDKLSCNYPILFIVDEDLVSIVKYEFETFLGKLCLAITYDTNEIKEIKEYGWFYPGTDIPIYQGIILSYDALPFFIEFIQKTDFLLICADATSNKTNSNTINNLLTDFIDDEENPKPKEEKDQLRLFEDYLKVSNLRSYLVISLLPYFFHLPTKNLFLDSFCEPTRVIQEEFVVCKMTPEQRTSYDEVISNNIENLNQDVVDCLNLIIDHPSFILSDFSFDSVTEKNAWPFIQKSGKMLILHEFIKKAIYEEKKTMIITTDVILLSLLEKYFHFIEKQYDVFTKSSDSLNFSKSQFILCLVDSDDIFPWIHLDLDWILCLTPFINPIYRNSNWDFLKNNVIKKLLVFRFFVEDTFESYLTVNAHSSRIEDHPNIIHYLRSSFNYPIRLLAPRSKISPFFLHAGQQSNQQPLSQDYIGDFEPCMLEKAHSILIPTTTLLFDEEQSNEDGKKITTHFLQYTEQNNKLNDALNYDLSGIDLNWPNEIISAIYRAISSVVWGNWDLMVMKMPIEISPGLMKDVSYLFLDHLLKISDREYKIAQTFVSKHVSMLDQISTQTILSSISNFMSNSKQNELNCRLDRIEDMMVLTMVLARCNVNNIPNDILLPKDLHDSLPSIDWKKDKDKKLLFSIYSNGYNSFGSEFNDFDFASLSCRFHALIQAFLPDIPTITGYKSVERSKNVSKGKVKPSKSLVKISKKSPSVNSQEQKKQDKKNENDEKANKTENDEKANKTENDEKIDKIENDEKIGKIESDEKIDIIESDEKSNKTENDEKSNKIEKNEKTNKIEKDEKSNKIEKNEKTNKIEKDEKINQIENDTKIEKIENTKKIYLGKKKKLKNVWTEEEQNDFTELLIQYGPQLNITDFRCLLPLEGKTDRDIITLKIKLVEYGKSGKYDEYVISPPAQETFQSSFDFFNEIDQLNPDDFYCEDQSTLKAMKFWGLKRCCYSPLLQSVFGTNMIGSSVLRAELDKIKNRKIGKEPKSKLKFRIKLKYNKGENHVSKSSEKLSNLNDDSKIESTPSNLNDNTKIERPFDTFQGRKIVYPVTVCHDISIVSIGQINLAPEFSNNDFIYPEGYEANCIFDNMELSCMIKSKNNAPLFRVINPTKKSKMSSSGKTPEEAWYNFFKDVLKISPYSFDLWRVPGHELFGLCSPLTKRIIQALPGASDCQMYKPVAFRTPIKDIESLLENNIEEEEKREEKEEAHFDKENEENVPSLVDDLSDEVETSIKIDNDNDVKIKNSKTKYKQKIEFEYKQDNEIEDDNEDDGDGYSDTEYKGYKYKYKAKKSPKIKQREKAKLKAQKIEEMKNRENKIKRFNLRRRTDKSFSSINYNENNFDDVNNDEDYETFTYKKSKQNEKNNLKINSHYINDNENGSPIIVKEPIKLKDKNKVQLKHRRIDNLLDNKNSENNQEETHNLLDDKNSENNQEEIHNLLDDKKSENNQEEIHNLLDNKNSENNQEEIHNLLDNKNSENNQEEIHNLLDDKNSENNAEEIHESFDNENHNDNEELRLDNENDSFPKNVKIDIEVKPLPPEPAKEKPRIKLSDFYSSENENENENENQENNLSQKYDSPILSPLPQLPDFDEKSNDNYDNLIQPELNNLNSENRDENKLDQEQENSFHTDEEELQPQEKPDLPNSQKKPISSATKPRKKPESIYSYYKESEDDENASNNEDSQDGEFVSRLRTKSLKSHPNSNTPSQTASTTTLQTSPNSTSTILTRKRGRKPKNSAQNQQKKFHHKYNDLESDDEYGNEDEDEDEEEPSAPHKKKDKNDKTFIYPFKVFEHTNVMQTRSSYSSSSKLKSKSKKKNKKETRKDLFDDDFNTKNTANKNKDEDEDVGRQLVMRPNFNSRRKRPKEPVVYGNWIETSKKNENENDIEIEKNVSQSSSERLSPPSPLHRSKSSTSTSATSSSSLPHKNAELHFDFSMLASKMEDAGGFGKTEIAFSSKELFKHINPTAHPDSFKNELKKFGDVILDNSKDVRDFLGFDEQSASGVWKKSVK